MTTSTDLKTFKIAKGTKAQIITAYNNGDIGDTDFAIATDEDYADASLSNATTGAFENVVAQAQATGKSTVVNWAVPDIDNPTVLNGSLANGDNSITIAKASLIVARTPQTTSITYISIKKSVDGVDHIIGTQYTEGSYFKRFSVSVTVPAGTYIINNTGTGGTYNVYPLKGVE